MRVNAISCPDPAAYSLAFVCFLFNCSLFCAFRFSSVSFPRFLNCFLSHSFSFLLPCPVLSNFVPLPLSFPFAFFLPLFPVPFSSSLSCPSVSLFCMFAVCSMQRLGTYVVFKSMHAYTYTHRLTVRMPVLFPRIAARKGEEKQWQDTWTFYSFHCSMCLSSSLFLSSCLFPFLLPLAFSCLIVLDISYVCGCLFSCSFFCSFLLCFVSVPFYLFCFLSILLLLSAAMSHSFLAILSFSCSSSLCFPCPFSAVVSSSFFLLLVLSFCLSTL